MFSEVAESDFTTLLAESEASEKEAQSNYDKLTEQNTVTKTANTQEVKGKEASVKSEETALLNYKEDFATTGKELDAVLAYLDKLKPQCETKEPHQICKNFSTALDVFCCVDQY